MATMLDEDDAKLKEVLKNSLNMLIKNGYHDFNDTVFFYDPKPVGWYTPEVRGDVKDEMRRSHFEFLMTSDEDFVQQVGFVSSGIKTIPMNIAGAVLACACVASDYDFGKTMELASETMALVNREVFGFYEKLESSSDKFSFFTQCVGKICL